jgi:hypothetical protein
MMISHDRFARCENRLAIAKPCTFGWEVAARSG